MGHLPVLPELVLVLGVGVVAAIAVAFLRLPAVAGFMLAGAVVGPSGLGLVRDVGTIEVLAEIGVILLLFTIGLEFSLARLKQIGRLVAVGGSLQVGFTTAVTVGVALGLGERIGRGVFFGFLIALSSTAIVLRGLSERGETEAPHGRFTIGALIFQDLCVVPMMLLVPVLAGQGSGSPAVEITLALGKAAIFVVVTLVGGRVVVPRVLARVDAAKSRELFLVAVLVVCAGIALLTAVFGLSLALGAFLAGILLSESAYGQRAMANVLPLRDVLTSLFFMSLGMLFDVGVLKTHGPLVGLLFVALFFGKGLVATLASIAMGFPARVAWLAGVSLAQFGEFGFVLAREGERAALMSSEESRVLLAAGLLTMFVTPLSMRLAPHVSAGAALLRPLERLLGVRGVDEAAPEHAALSQHVIIAGYGLGGQLVAGALRSTAQKYMVLDLDAETVRTARAQEELIYYGDVTSEEALLHANLPRAAALVLLISDTEAARQVIAVARKVAPDVPIVVRARRQSDVAGLVKLGATDVVAEEFEGGIETLARVLRIRGIPINVLGSQVREARARGEESARRVVFPRHRVGELRALDELKVESIELTSEMRAVGRSLVELELRKKSGAHVLCIQRGDALLEHLDPRAALENGDVLFLAGTREAVYLALGLLEGRVPAMPTLPPSAPTG